MAERTAAGIFKLAFDLLARNPSEEHKALAEELWEETLIYDFTPDQMGADKSLEALGLLEDGEYRE